jgi:hypothetical protein
MSDIDVPVATEILPLLDEPLAKEERRLLIVAPELAPSEVLDLALKHAILHLRYTVSLQTFEFLRWKVVVAREAARRALEASVSLRAAREAAQEELSRQYSTEDFSRWSVTEIAGNVLARPGQRCLIFASADTVRRVWNYPPDWRELSDAELETLSWGL